MDAKFITNRFRTILQLKEQGDVHLLSTNGYGRKFGFSSPETQQRKE